jgi:hypothetical protein
MASTSSFSPRNVEFNRFLFAAIGDDKNGMVLTVASALARLGFDPWNEAGRLSRLPRIGAADALAGMIAKLPVGDWQISELSEIAARLTQLLPALGAPIAPTGVGARPAARTAASKMMMWIACLSLLAVAIYAMTSAAAPRLDFPPVPAASVPSPPLH